MTATAATNDDPQRAQLNGDEAAFMLAGNAVVTFVSPNGGRFTYKIKKCGAVHFVSLLTGPLNIRDFKYIGTIFDGQTFRWTSKSQVVRDAPSVRGFGVIWGALVAGCAHSVEIWHEGLCGKCGRTLTVPESIASGFGPKCRAG